MEKVKQWLEGSWKFWVIALLILAGIFSALYKT
jgi:hypothetical protein